MISLRRINWTRNDNGGTHLIPTFARPPAAATINVPVVPVYVRFTSRYIAGNKPTPLSRDQANLTVAPNVSNKNSVPGTRYTYT